MPELAELLRRAGDADVSAFPPPSVLRRTSDRRSRRRVGLAAGLVAAAAVTAVVVVNARGAAPGVTPIGTPTPTPSSSVQAQDGGLASTAWWVSFKDSGLGPSTGLPGQPSGNLKMLVLLDNGGALRIAAGRVNFAPAPAGDWSASGPTPLVVGHEGGLSLRAELPGGAALPSKNALPPEYAPIEPAVDRLRAARTYRVERSNAQGRTLTGLRLVLSDSTGGQVLILEGVDYDAVSAAAAESPTSG